MNIGEKIKKYRKENKITQKQLAELINKNIRTIQKYEANEIEIPLGNLVKISKYLNLPIDILEFKQDISNIEDDALIKELIKRGYVVSRPLEKEY